MIRVAAVGDVHVGLDSRGTLRSAFTSLDDTADVLLIAGDLTPLGMPDELADSLCRALCELETDVRIALLHFAPVKDTLSGERLEIFPFLGSYLLGEPVDSEGADLVIHGHAHHGVEQGVTTAGVPARNVALSVIGQSYKL